MNNPNIEWVAANEVFEYEKEEDRMKALALLFKYDSVHGKAAASVEPAAGGFLLNGKLVKIVAEKDPAKLPWKELKVDLVVESTGRFTSGEKCQGHITAGAKRVVITAPPKKSAIPVKSIVMGVNESIYDPKADFVISNASCTTNCVVPVAKVIHENFRIKHAYMTTIHAYTGDQRILDTAHKDLRRARAAAVSMIPTSTGAAKLIGVVFPELNGKVQGCAIRVPTANVSLVDLTCEVEKPTDDKTVNAAFQKASAGPLGKYLEYSTEPLVSVDLNGNPHSAIFDSLLTTVVNGTQVKVFAWYDNEWGYSNRIIDLIDYIRTRG
jgi:glyceraldehyde 3-phosphate dehydrogenase